MDSLQVSLKLFELMSWTHDKLWINSNNDHSPWILRHMKVKIDPMFRIVQQASSISFWFGEDCLYFYGENLSDLAYIMGLAPKEKGNDIWSQPLDPCSHGRTKFVECKATISITIRRITESNSLWWTKRGWSRRLLVPPQVIISATMPCVYGPKSK